MRRCTLLALRQYDDPFSRATHVGEGHGGQRVQIGFIWFPHTRLVSRAQIENTLIILNTFINSASNLFLAQFRPHQPLFTLAGIPRHKMRFIIIYVAGHKIAETNCSWHKFFELLFIFLKNILPLSCN